MQRINILKAPFDFHRSRGEVLTIRETGEFIVGSEVPQDMAKAAVAQGYGVLVEPEPKNPATTRRTRARLPANAADPGQPTGVDRTDLAPDDSADGGAAVAHSG